MSRRVVQVRDKNRRVVAQDRDLEIARLVLTYRAVVRENVQLAFGLSLHRANKRLRALFDAGWLRREADPLSGKIIYTLGGAALPPLADATGEPLTVLKKRADRPGYLNHALGLCDASLRLQKALEGKSGLTLEKMLIERDAVDEFLFQIGTAPEERCLIRPDALLTLRVQERRFHLVLEYDTGSVAWKPFQEKAKGFKIWQDSGAMAEVHGEGQLLILVLTGSERRIENLQKVVRAAGMQDRYLFASRLEFLQAPRDLLLDTPLWLRGSQRPVSLASLLSLERIDP